jgi:hypothetical protein
MKSTFAASRVYLTLGNQEQCTRVQSYTGNALKSRNSVSSLPSFFIIFLKYHWHRYPQKCLPSAPTDVKTQFDGSLEQNTRKVMWSPAFSPESPVLEYKVSCVSGDMESSKLVPGDSFSAIVSGLELGSNVYTCTVTAITAAGSGPTSLPSEPFVTPDILTLEKYPTPSNNASFGVWRVDRFKPAVWEKISYEGKTDVRKLPCYSYIRLQPQEVYIKHCLVAGFSGRS